MAPLPIKVIQVQSQEPIKEKEKRVIDNLYNILPNIILFISAGFCFVKVFCFIYAYRDSENIDNMLTASLVVGYIICQIAFAIPLSLGVIIDNICIIASSIIMGFIAGKIINGNFMYNLIEKLNINRTVNEFLWSDLLDKDGKIMKAQITINETKYSGKIHLVEEFSNTPHIVLGDYSINDQPENNPNKIIVLDTSKATDIIIEYDKCSSMLEKIRFYE